MTIPKRAMAGTAVGLGFVAINLGAELRWRRNPDPLEGEVPRFPAGDTIAIPTDDGAEIRVVRAGDGPTVVLIHGITSNADDWGPIARRLVERGHRVLGINQRGHNGSTVGSDGFDATRLGRDLRQVLDALDLQNIVLVGHSMGGIAAMTFAVDHPDDLRRRVAGLCLVSTLARTNDAAGRAGIALIAGRPRTSIGGHGATADRLRRHAARFVFGRRPNWDLMGHAVATALRCQDQTRVDAARGLVDYDISDRLHAIDIPTTVLCGTADLITRFAKNLAIAEALPQSRLVPAAGAGHMLVWEAPDTIADEIAALAGVG